MTVHVIEAEHYRTEVKTLMADPIIRGMATGVTGLSDQELEGWSFISAASDEYHRRGGTVATSIGGPARAIAALLKENEW